MPLANGVGSVALAAAIATAAPPVPRDGQSDFDFVFGRWKIHNRRLQKPLSGSTTWYEFEGASVARPIWGGKAHVDEYEAESPSGRIQGMTVRLYDPQSKQWTIYWANAAKGAFDVPMVGAFRDGVGAFYDQETYEGRAVYVRFLWTVQGKDACRWEQAFSADGGTTWETNWIMEMTREP